MKSDVLALMALVVSILAAAFTALQWYEAREMRQLQFDSVLGFDVDTELPQHRAGIAVRNIGPGIAVVKSVTYYLDGKETDSEAALRSVRLDANKDDGFDMEAGEPMAAGETDWLVLIPFRRADEREKAIDLFEHHLQVAVAYCSANGRCARVCTTEGQCPSSTVPN